MGEEMKTVKVVVSGLATAKGHEELLVILVSRGRDGKVQAHPFYADLLGAVAGFAEFSGKQEQCLALYPPFPAGELSCRRLLLVGLGEIDQSITGEDLVERLRLAGGAIAGHCKKQQIERLALSLQPPEAIADDQAMLGEYLVEGLLLGAYQFGKYKTKKNQEEYGGLKRVELLGSGNLAATRRAVARGAHCAASVCVARDMANEPGNHWTPTHFAKYAKKSADKLGMQCRVLDKKEMEKLGMGGILAVSQGSKEPPKMVIVDYNPGKGHDTVLLVGKGLTFDSGGVSLKPAEKMMDMKYDMCGGAAVLAAMAVIAVEKPKVRVVAIIPSSDNMAGGGALKPGDVIRHYGGLTSEIENTDAEGRLLLGDAIAYGIEKYQPACVIDLATLTGSVVIALGHHYSGLMSNSDRLVDMLIGSGARSGEPLWRLPLGEMYVKQLDSRVADMKNTGGRYGGAITAAEYLHHFVGETPWAHVDIAGTAWDFTEKSYIPKGPSGIGVRTLVELIRLWPDDPFSG
jgi:leucyl aminopeptidase